MDSKHNTNAKAYPDRPKYRVIDAVKSTLTYGDNLTERLCELANHLNVSTRTLRRYDEILESNTRPIDTRKIAAFLGIDEQELFTRRESVAKAERKLENLSTK